MGTTALWCPTAGVRLPFLWAELHSQNWFWDRNPSVSALSLVRSWGSLQQGPILKKRSVCNFVEAQHYQEWRGCCSIIHLFFLNCLNVHGLSGYGLIFSLLSDKRNKACKVIFTLIYRWLHPSKTSIKECSREEGNKKLSVLDGTEQDVDLDFSEEDSSWIL